MKTTTSLISSLATLCAVVLAVPHPHLNAKREPNTATVTLSAPRGPSSQLVSGVLYGVPDAPNDVPDELYTGIKFNYLRAGGSQLPQKGWLESPESYGARFQSALGNYKTARGQNARFQLLVADLWGADSLQASDAPFPGDNGDWSSFENFLDSLISDINDNNMRDGLDIDIWNEPDNRPFWGRDQQQYLEMYGRAHAKYRSSFGNEVPLVGPSTLSQPSSNPDWWNNYLRFISDNSSIPDEYSWHLLLNADDVNVDPEYSLQKFNDLRGEYNLPERSISLNEFALKKEQQPGASVWYIARFERNNIRGLRANYGFGGVLRDYFAGLLGKPGAGTDAYDPQTGGYYPNGEWQLIRYYAQNMTGERLATTGTEDKKFEAYATTDNNNLKLIVGSRLRTGTWSVALEGLSGIGISGVDTISLRRLRFDFQGEFGEVGDPVDEGIQNYDVLGDAVVFDVTIEDQNIAYAYELA